MRLSVFFGLVVVLASLIGGYMAMGGHLAVIWQPWEFVIIMGMSAGTYIMANPWKTVVDTGKATIQAITVDVPKQRHYLDLLGLMHSLMREVRNKGRNEVEAHIDDPSQSEIFTAFPTVLANEPLTQFICDYFRLMVMGSARTHEIEALMDEEIETMRHDKLKSYHALVTIAEALPALGIVAAVLGVIKAMGALDEDPEILGSLIGAALVGTFAGIFISYAIVAPLASKLRGIREKRMRIYVVVKQTLLAFMNGAMPPVALEHGRKAISAYERPSIDEVEQKAFGGGSAGEAAARKEAA